MSNTKNIKHEPPINTIIQMLIYLIPKFNTDE